MDEEFVQTMDKMFADIKVEADMDYQLRTALQEVTKKLENSAEETHCELLKFHQPSSNEEELGRMRTIADSEIKMMFAKIAEILTSHNYYRYHSEFRNAVQHWCFLVSFAYFLDSGLLADRRFIATQLGMELEAKDGFHLDLEDYLFGILKLANELARYSVNVVVKGDYSTPFKIAKFLKNMEAEFRLLNLKNSSLRRVFDALKYDVQKAEQVVYDLSIRGMLVKKSIDYDQYQHQSFEVRSLVRQCWTHKFLIMVI
ncbi:hypothetical protein AB6A40_001330 [Gnathostoma spinigerum]|uniref:Translin n=1 Tax=Gnathostoma spinigerum TaxID=75299 RepID=A0ABD6EB30_9BILA